MIFHHGLFIAELAKESLKSFCTVRKLNSKASCRIPEATLWLVVKDFAIATRLCVWIVGLCSWLTTCHVFCMFMMNDALTTHLRPCVVRMSTTL